MSGSKRTRATKPAFPVSPTSPFPDGYDIERERQELQDLIQAEEIDPADPRFTRFVELERREEMLKSLLSVPRAPRPPALNELAQIGALASDDEDTMTLHTRDAMRLFSGRPAGNGLRAIAGGRRVAASLRQLWSLSSNGNPFADWLLVQFDADAARVRDGIGKEATAAQSGLEALRQKGLNYSVLKSSAPVTVSLGFVSPYGYAVASLVVEMDWLCRVIKSAQRRDVISTATAHDLLFQVKRNCRSIFEPIVRGATLLTREELRPLTRADFMSSDEGAKKRVEAAQALFGLCPRDVFTGERAPRHSRSNTRLSEKELALLESVPFADSESGDAKAGLIE